MKDQSRQPVRRCAQPIELVHTDASSRAVVCLHGFTGYPGELALPRNVFMRQVSMYLFQDTRGTVPTAKIFCAPEVPTGSVRPNAR